MTDTKKACKSLIYRLLMFFDLVICGHKGVEVEHLIPFLMFLDEIK